MSTQNVIRLETYRRPAVTTFRPIPGRITEPKEATVICLQTARAKRNGAHYF